MLQEKSNSFIRLMFLFIALIALANVACADIFPAQPTVRASLPPITTPSSLVEPTEVISTTLFVEPTEIVVVMSSTVASAELEESPPPTDSNFLQPTVTLFPTPIATNTPPPPLTPTLSLDAPVAGTQSVAGTGLDVSGVATSISLGQLVHVQLMNLDGTTASDVRLVAKDGAWRALLLVPDGLLGEMKVVASVTDLVGKTLVSAEKPVFIINGDTASNANFTINYISPIVVEGKGIHLRGEARSTYHPFTINLAVYYNDCKDTLGYGSFDMYFDGAWFGYLTLPVGITGTVCAVAVKGAPGLDNPDTVTVKLNAISSADPAAVGVIIANPQPNQNVTASFQVEGLAYNSPNGTVTVRAEGKNGELYWELIVPVDSFGYWKTYMTLLTGDYTAQIVAIIGDPANPVAVARHPISIGQPSPDPTLPPLLPTTVAPTIIIPQPIIDQVAPTEPTAELTVGPTPVTQP